MKINKTLKPLSIWLVGITLLGCTSKQNHDRYDENLVSSIEDKQMLYKEGKVEKVLFSAENLPNLQKTPNSKQAFFSYKNINKPELSPGQEANLDETHALISLNWTDKTPSITLWKKYSGDDVKWLNFSIPLTPSNSFAYKSEKNEDKTGNSYFIVTSIRKSTFGFWSDREDYDLYAIRISEHMETVEVDGKKKQVKAWGIDSLTPITSNDSDDVQAVITPDKKEIVYLETGEDSDRLMRTSLDGQKTTLIAEYASLPYILPKSKKLLFVMQKDEFKEFYVYDFKTKLTKLASDSEISGAIAAIPYQRLKSKYLLIDNFKPQKNDPIQSYSLESFLMKGLKRSPEILKNYYKYEASLSTSTVENEESPIKFFAGANAIPKDHIVTDQSDEDFYDRTSEDFLRVVGGISIPIIPNYTLRYATFDSNRCQEEVYRQRLHRAINSYINKVAVASFDYIEAEKLVNNYREALTLNTKLTKSLQSRQEAGIEFKSTTMEAERELTIAQSDYHLAVERLINCKFQLAALLGGNISEDIEIKAPQLNWSKQPIKIPSLNYFIGQAELNSPDIQRLNAMILKAASIRDMGIPESRVDPLALNIGYGLGFDNWSNLVDDFLQLGLTTSFPILTKKKDEAYYKQWTNEIKVMRQEKYQLQAELKRDIHKAYMNLMQNSPNLKALRSSLAYHQENLRLSTISTERDGSFKSTKIEQLKNHLYMLEDQRKLIKAECNFFRFTANLYGTSGISIKLAPQLCKVTKPLNEGKHEISKRNGLFLWDSLSVVKDKKKREDFFSFVKGEKITRVYFFLSRTKDKQLYLETYKAEIAYFLQKAAEHGIEVYALMGNVDWMKTSYKTEVTKLISALNSFNQSQAILDFPTFKGLKIDVEPHALSNWQSAAQSKLINRYLSLLDEIKVQTNLPLAVDIPYTYNGLKVRDQKGDFIEQIAKKVDLITVMAYLNRFDKIIKKIDPILNRKDLPAVIEVAVETAPLSEKGLSFAEKSYKDLNTVTTKIQQKYQNHKRMIGVVIHDYKHFKLLNTKSPSKEGK